MIRTRLLILLLILIVAGVLHGCRSGPGEESDDDLPSWRNKKYPKIQVDLKQIRERGKLVAITSYSSTSYFLYRGKPMGYEYELLKNLSEYLDLDLEIKVARDMDKIIDMLLKGEGDIISYGMAVTRERLEKMAFTEHHTKTHQVLVQRKPTEWRNMRRHEIEESLIRDPLELIGKTVHVRKDSAYYSRLRNLMEHLL